ncbi:hypothetical protein [Acetobacter indonesiensis]|uniref:hypothetical protein n=2 Tax=Acetobacter indonesiensis TaxID=104101 RepID=UPI0039BF8D89
MSGSTTNTTASGIALSSLSSTDTPKATDLVFGIFDGQGQFVPQSKVWAGAVDKQGDTVEGALSAAYEATEPEHLVPKSYVDAQGDKIAASVTGAAAAQVTAAQTAAQNAQTSETNAKNAESGAANAASTAINAQKGAPNGVVAISANGHLMLDGQELFGVQNGHLIFVLPLPTSDPGVANAWWNNGGTIYISQG